MPTPAATRHRSRHGPVLAASAAGGLVFAVAPSFSGLALVAILLFGAFVAASALLAPYPPSRQEVPTPGLLRAWLGWLAGLAVLEGLILMADDDLRWPTLSALQDPLTMEPLGRFLAGAGWTAAGFGLIALVQRFPGGGFRRLSACLALVVGSGLVILAIRSVDDGPMLLPREAYGARDSPADWPGTAWLTLAAFAALAVAAAAIHIRGRRHDPPGAIDDLLAWAMASWPGRVLILAAWLWSGWHFLGR